MRAHGVKSVVRSSFAFFKLRTKPYLRACHKKTSTLWIRWMFVIFYSKGFYPLITPREITIF